MPSRRRRLRTVSSSSDEGEDKPRQHPQNSQQHNRNQNNILLEQAEEQDEAIIDEIDIAYPEPAPNLDSVNLNPPEPIQLSSVSSDEVFIDVSDNLSLPSSPSPPAQPPMRNAPVDSPSVYPRNFNSGSSDSSDCPIMVYLRSHGLNLRREWLDSCVLGLQAEVRDFSSYGVEMKAKFCFEQVLFHDLNFIAGDCGVLPDNVASLHNVNLPGPYVLQVDEMINISCPLRQRYQNANHGIKRCLKLCMTDGFRRVFGMEYHPIPVLDVLAPAGFKVLIKNVHVRRGLLMLVPAALQVLGGCVEELEAARQRLVDEVNKPPRGKRTRTGVVSPLAMRATQAAWSPNVPNNSANTSNSRLTEEFHDVSVATSGDGQTRTTRNSSFSAGVDATDICVSGHGLRRTTEESAFPVTEVTTYFSVSGHGSSNSTMTRGESAVPTGEETTDAPIIVHVSPRTTREPDVADGLASNMETTESTLGPCPIPETDHVHMNENVEHSFILSGDKELPFTYLASLSAKWVAMKENEPYVQGKIKCFLTGVKSFQYKQKTNFELRAYVDDGSLISEILIHHDVVRREVGFSPEEVTAALSSSDTRSDMQEILKKFQILLVNFEGTMLVEMNETSDIPIALEMEQGCVASDVWLLLQRLVSVSSNQPCPNNQMNPPHQNGAYSHLSMKKSE